MCLLLNYYVIFLATINVGWFNCAKTKLVILIYAQLDHSVLEAAKLESGSRPTEGRDIFINR